MPDVRPKFFLAPVRLRFGDCQLDTDSRVFSRRGTPVHLSPKAFRLLQLLAENRPRALSKKEIEDELWPETFVSESSLTVLVAEVRRACGESAHSAMALRTVHGFGYAFAAESRLEKSTSGLSSDSDRRWTLEMERREIALDDGENLIGRDPEARVRIDDRDVSRRHARIRIEGESAVIEDLGSKNGTYVDGHRLTRPSPIASGSEVQIGQHLMRIRSPFGTASTRTARRPRRLSPARNRRA